MKNNPMHRRHLRCRGLCGRRIARVLGRPPAGARMCLPPAMAPPALAALCWWAWAVAWACNWHAAGATADQDKKGVSPWHSLKPVTLSARGVTLVPLGLEHEAGLRAAASDGELWTLRITSVPEPEQTRKYIEDALAMREAGNRLCLRRVGGSHRQSAGLQQLPRHRAGPQTRVEIGWTWYGKSSPAQPRQHHRNSKLLLHDPRLRDAGLPCGGLAHRQLQLRVPGRHRTPGRQKRRRASAATRCAAMAPSATP